MSVLEKAGYIVTRFMLYCNTDLSKNTLPIFKHIGGEVVADPEIPSRGLLFFFSVLTLIWYLFYLDHSLIAFENWKDIIISLYALFLHSE